MKNGATRQLATQQQLNVGRICAFAEDAGGTLWVAGELGIDLIDAAGVRELRHDDQPWRVATQLLLRDHDDHLLLGSEIGLYLMLDGQLLAIDPDDRRRVPVQDQAHPSPAAISSGANCVGG